MSGFAVVLDPAADENRFVPDPWGPRLAAKLRHRGHVEIRSEGPLCIAEAIDVDAGRGGRVASHAAFDALRGLTLAGDWRLHGLDELRRKLGVAQDVGEETLILLAYRRWGRDLGRHLRGGFAIVLHDAHHPLRLLVIRDHMGLRPVHYAFHQGRIGVATEVRQLMVLFSELPPLDHVGVVHALSGRWRDRECTVWEPIRRLPGGHAVVIDQSTTTAPSRPIPTRYWERALPQQINAVDEREHLEHIRSIFDSIVAREIGDDGVVFADLSGGHDSSAVAATAAEVQHRLGGSVLGGAIVLDDPQFDDLPFSRAQAAHSGIELLTHLDAHDVAAMTERAAFWFDLPGPYGTDARLHFASIAAGRGARAYFTGYQGEYLMGSPHAHLEQARTGNLRSSGGPGRATTLRSLAAALVRRHRPVELPATLAWIDPDLRAAAGVGRADPAPSLRNSRVCATARRVSYEDTVFDRLMIRADREVARHGMRMVHPYHDLDLCESLLALPESAFHEGQDHRRLHRSLFGDRYHPSVAARRTKGGFTTSGRNFVASFDLDEMRTDSRLVEVGVTDASSFGRLLDTASMAPDRLLVEAMSALEVELMLRATTMENDPDEE